MKKSFKLISMILPITIGSSLIYLSCCNKTQEVNFANDSWENIISYANKGIKALIDHYKPNGGTFVITPADVSAEQIAAKTRTIHLDNYGDFKVRVIGECIDKIDDNNNAALTFEFSEIITKDSFHNDLTVANPSYYPTSHIKEKLSEIINCFPNILKNNLKTVKQTTAVITQTGNYDSIVTDEKLFILTLDEVYGVLSDNEPLIFSENYCYQNYQYSQNQTTNAHIKQYFNKQTGKYENCRYWLRTPFIKEEETDNKQCFYIDNDGFFTNKPVDTIAGIAPCFCLGSEKNGIINIGCFAPGFDVCNSQIVDINQDIVIKIKPKTYNGKDVCKLPDGTDEGKSEFRIFNELGPIYSTHFKYDASKGEIIFVQNRINKSLVFEMWNSKIILDYKNFALLCEEDEKNNKNGSLISNYVNVGDWITVRMDDQDYKINIIGIGHDTIDNNKKAAVTFEFYDTLNGYKWDDNGECDYITSSLNKNLNGTQSQSVINKLSRACPDLASSIKNTHKNVFTKKENNWVVEEMKTKLFILSDDEFLGIARWNDIPLGKYYKYYEINNKDLDLVTRFQQEMWTRSSYIKEDEKKVLIFKKEQSCLMSDLYSPTYDDVHTAPAFCI